MLDKLLEKLKQAGLPVVIRPTKCVFGPDSVECLGHSIGENSISINEENLEKIRGAKRPTTKKEVRSFLGLANYYRDHMSSFASIAAPPSDLTKKGLPESVRGEDAQEKTFVTIRESLVRRPILRLPDHNKTFILPTDASVELWTWGCAYAGTRRKIFSNRVRKEEADICRAEVFHH